jgi:hypothetical protein
MGLGRRDHDTGLRRVLVSDDAAEEAMMTGWHKIEAGWYKHDSGAIVQYWRFPYVGKEPGGGAMNKWLLNWKGFRVGGIAISGRYFLRPGEWEGGWIVRLLGTHRPLSMMLLYRRIVVTEVER